MNEIIKYGLAVLKKGKLLINRKRNTNLYLLPGGKPELNESAEDCLSRETEEEHKVELIESSLKFFGKFEDIAANEPDSSISIRVYIGEIKGDPFPSREIEEQKWFGKEDDPEILSPVLKNKILPALIEKGLVY